MSSVSIQDVIAKLTEKKTDEEKAKAAEKYEDDEITKYKTGTTTLADIDEKYNTYRKDMYDAIEDFVYKPAIKSQKIATDTLLPQLRFINELTHVINTFPHQKLPQTTAFLAELTERAKYTMQNITNFNGVAIGEPVIGVERAMPTVPYVNVQGGGGSDSDSNDLDGDYNENSSSESSGNPVTSRRLSSKQKSKTEDSSSESSDKPEKKSKDAKIKVSSSDKKQKKSKLKEDVLSRTPSSESSAAEDSSDSSIEKVADTSSSSSSLAQEGGRRKKRVKRTKKKTNQAHTRTL